MDAAEVGVLLNQLAQRFENAEEPAEGLPSARGWGQFLDDPKTHHQTGPYGTSAGLIVSALAGRAPQALEPRIGNLVRSWWDDWKNSNASGRKLFCQTPRLAFFFLGLRLSHILDADGTCKEVEEELFRRSLPVSGMWGNYWTSDVLMDQTPRLFCSSIVVLCIALLADAPSETLKRLEPSVASIEQSLMGSRDLPLLHAAVACAAILAVRGGSTSSSVKKRIRKIAWSARADLADLGVYFYDFQASSTSGTPESGRDYFIVPSELLMGIAGLQGGAPVALRQRAEATVRALAANMSSNQGVYRSDPEQRVSSKNQAWAALLVFLSKGTSPSGHTLGALWYALRRERKGNWFTEIAFPLMSLCAIAWMSVAFRELGMLTNVMTTIGTIIVGGLYGSTFLRKWFPGR